MANKTNTAPKGYKNCRRCAGSGAFMNDGRVCYGCAGYGVNLIITSAIKIADKRKHIAEVEGQIARHTARLAELPTDAPRWKREPVENWLAKDSANLVKLTAELAAL